MSSILGQLQALNPMREEAYTLLQSMQSERLLALSYGSLSIRPFV